MLRLNTIPFDFVVRPNDAVRNHAVRAGCKGERETKIEQKENSKKSSEEKSR